MLRIPQKKIFLGRMNCLWSQEASHTACKVLFLGLGWRVVPRLPESHLLTPFSPEDMVHATWGPLLCPALYRALQKAFPTRLCEFAT